MTKLRDPEWWTALAADVLDLRPGSVAKDLAKLLTSIPDEDARQAMEHTKGVLESLEKDPLPIDPDLKLQQVYITPSACYWAPGTKEKHNRDRAGNIPDLMASLMGTLEDSDLPIIIHGQPGHGKTSSVKMLVHAIAGADEKEKKKDRRYGLMYEFKYLSRLDDNEIKVLEKRTSFLKSEGFFKGKNTILILDGLDERQVADGSDYALKDFIRCMFRLAETVNKRDDSRLNLVLTGRSQFVKHIQSAFTGQYHLYEIKDFTAEQVGTWLGKYCTAKEVEPALTYKDFESKSLKDLAHQPILLTICAMMLVDDVGRRMISDLGAETITRGMIYQTIIQWTYERKWQCHPNCDHLPDKESYKRFLRTLAFVLFRRGKETIKISDLISDLRKNNDLYDINLIRTKNDETVETICRDVAVSFFFKGLEENAFSFIHKTVKDYLTVEAIFEFLLDITSGFNDRRSERSCENMAKDLYFVFGKGQSSPGDHRPFMQDIIQAREDEAKRILEPLKTFFISAQEHVYFIKHEGGQNENPIATEALVLAGLFHWITEISHGLDEKKLSGVFPSLYSFKMFISILNCFHVHQFDSCQFNLAFIELRGAYLFRAGLLGADLLGADLRDADLRGAYLSDADLRRAHLRDAGLRKAHLSGAQLGEANLVGADLSNADIDGADLRGADLRGADLRGADLSGADLRGADLRSAELSSAELSSAYLDRAILSGAYLRRTDLHCSDLSEADLSEADLHGANLIDANLSRANLSHAVLAFVDLSGADLRGANLEKVKGLTADQLRSAANIENAVLPSDLKEIVAGHQKSE